MKFRNILRGFCILSGAVVGTLAASSRRRAQMKSADCGQRRVSDGPPAARRDYFSITRTRSKTKNPKWVLQGFGRFECFLLFDTWREAMHQANFRIESVVTGDLIQLVN